MLCKNMRSSLATIHCLSQCWTRSPYGITRPQWVNNNLQHIPSIVPIQSNITYITAVTKAEYTNDTPYLAHDGVSFVKILKKIDPIIMALHCSPHFAVFCCVLVLYNFTHILQGHYEVIYCETNKAHQRIMDMVYALANLPGLFIFKFDVCTLHFLWHIIYPVNLWMMILS